VRSNIIASEVIKPINTQYNSQLPPECLTYTLDLVWEAIQYKMTTLRKPLPVVFLQEDLQFFIINPQSQTANDQMRATIASLLLSESREKLVPAMNPNIVVVRLNMLLSSLRMR